MIERDEVVERLQAASRGLQISSDSRSQHMEAMAELLNTEKKESRSFSIPQMPSLALMRNTAIVVVAFWVGVAFAAYSDGVPGDVFYAAKRAAEQPARIVDPGIVVNNRVEELGELISRGADADLVLTARLDATNALAGTDPDEDLTRVFGLLAWPGLPPGYATDATGATEPEGLLISKSEWFNEDGYTAALVDGYLVTISAVDGEILIGTSGGWSAFTTGTGWRLASDDVGQVYTIDRTDSDELRVIVSGPTDSASGAGDDDLLAGRSVFGEPLSDDGEALATDVQGWPTTKRSTTSQPSTVQSSTSQSPPTSRPSGNAPLGSTTSQRTAGSFEPRSPGTSATSSTTDTRRSSTTAARPESTVPATTRLATTRPATTRRATTRPTQPATTASTAAPSTTRLTTSRPPSTTPSTTAVATTRTTATTASTTTSTVVRITAPPSTTTTTTVPPVASGPFFLDSSSSGNTSSSRTLPLRSGAAPSGPLRNFDTNRDSFPGLMIQKDGAGLSTSDSSKSQEWSLTISDPGTFDGPVSLTIWLAAKDFKTDERIGLLASLDLCSPGCTRLGTGQWSGGGENGFRKATVGFGSVDRAVPAGSTLRLKVVVPDGLATTDVWFAYDSGSHPSRINIG